MSVTENKSTDKKSVPEREIDLLKLVNILYTAKNRIIIGVLVFALIGLAISFLMPQKWRSQAVIVPAETMQWQELQQALVTLQVLDIDTGITRSSIFGRFIQKFQSRSLLEDFLTSSPRVRTKVNQLNMQTDELHRTVVTMSDNMTSASSNPVKAGAGISPYASWTLSFVAATAQDAQGILKEYIDYVSATVKKETLLDINNMVRVKTLLAEGSLKQKHMSLENLRSTNLQRLNYALEIARAAGIKKPVYSSGLAGGDDPDYPVMLGADGIEKKLAIEMAITDVSKLDSDFYNEKSRLEQLRNVVIPELHFEPFVYQQSPSLPMTKDNPGRGIIILLSALLGGLLCCTWILVRHGMIEYRNVAPR